MSSQWYGQHGAQPANAGQIPVVTSLLKDFSAEALGELRTWLEQNPPAVTIQSIVGFTQFVVRAAPSIQTAEGTTSATYVDLATVGPTLTMLPDGQYLVLYGAYGSTSSAAQAVWMSVQPNSTAASDNDAAAFNTTSGVPGARGFLATLRNAGNNTLTAKYRADGAATGSFGRRWMIAFKYANL